MDRTWKHGMDVIYSCSFLLDYLEDSKSANKPKYASSQLMLHI